jgi:hypothetical protein
MLFYGVSRSEAASIKFSKKEVINYLSLQHLKGFKFKFIVGIIKRTTKVERIV